MEYGDGRMDTSTSNITLKLVHKPNIISTQMSLLLDCSRTDQSIIYYPTFNRSYRNGWKIRSMTIKNELVHTISYKLHQYMPRSILVLLAQFMILPFCSLSNEFPGFSNLPLSNRSGFHSVELCMHGYVAMIQSCLNSHDCSQKRSRHSITCLFELRYTRFDHKL